MGQLGLVLVTNDFPFGDNSDFLGAEIRALAASFDEVTAVPLNGRGERAELPPNVHTDTALMRSNSRTRRLRALLRVSCWPTLIREVVRALRDHQPRAIPAVVLAVGKYSLVLHWARRLPPPAVAYSYWLGPATAAMRRAWPGTPIVSRAHGGDLFWERFDPPLAPLQALSVQSASRVASVSRVGATYLKQKHPGSADKIDVAPLGSRDVGRVVPASGDGTVRVLSVASLLPVKRPLLLARAVAAFAQFHSSVEWHHFGDGPLRGAVEHHLADNPSEHLRVVLHGQLSHDELLEHISEGPWDAFVSVSASEGVPVSMMEVKSGGIPLVATRAGGTEEVVDADIDQLIDVDVTADEVSAAIARAVASPDERQLRRSRWEQHWSADRNDAAFVRGLVDLANSTRLRRGQVTTGSHGPPGNGADR